MWTRMSNIWFKEVMDSLRDRKALRQAIVVPLVVGIFYAVFNPWISSTMAESAKAPITIPTQGMENADPAFVAALKKLDITLRPYTGDLQAAVRSGEKQAGLIIPEGFTENLNSEHPASLTLLTNRTSGGIFGGSFSGERLDLAVSNFSQALTVQRVQARNIDPSVLTPISVESQELATPEQLAGLFAAFTLPMLLAIIVAQGGLFIAIDTTAGEKERGTLESLLVTPATDFEIFTGKLLAVFTITCIPIALTFTGFWVASNFVPDTFTNGGKLPVTVIFGAIALSLPLALFVGVVLMIVSVRTRSFKDAQSAATPISFAVIVPSMAAAFVVPTALWMYLIPLYGPSAVVSGLAIGTKLDPMAYVLAILGSLIAAAVGFVIALRLFNRERLLYSV